MEYTEGQKPWNWTGEPIIEPRGYILIFVGKEHHLADCRGYAYEHRVVAEQMLGRRLLPGEQVHHKDENPGNNDPLNLIITGSRAEHAVYHRSPAGARLRRPGEDNPLIACECGCLSMFLRFDREGRPRRFVTGHNMYRSRTMESANG